MAVTMGGISPYLWQCVSTDTFPAPPTYSPKLNESLLVTDTGVWYQWNGASWSVSNAAPPPMRSTR